jgi:hypothetical protein
MKKLLLALAILSMTGCASTQYAKYAEAQQAIATSKSDSEIARYKALSDLAVSGSETAKVAAVMALALGNPQGTASTQHVAAPQNELLQWASLIVPSLTNTAGMYFNFKSNETNSNNAAAVSMSTNDAFVGIAGKIQSPSANVSTVTTTTTSTDSHNTSADQTMSGTGVLGSGSYATTATPVFQPVVVTNPLP